MKLITVAVNADDTKKTKKYMQIHRSKCFNYKQTATQIKIKHILK